MKKHQVIIISSILILTFFSCNKKIKLNHNNQVFSKFPKEQKIYFNEFYEFKEGVPGKLHLMDSTLIILNNGYKGNKFYFKNFSLTNKKLYKSYVRKGIEAGESIGGVTSGVIEGKLWLYDITLNKVIIINNPIEMSNNLDFNEYSITKSYYMLDFIDVSNFLANGSFLSQFKVQKVRLRDNHVLDEFGEYDNYPKNFSVSELKSAYESFICKNKNNDKLALGYRFTDVIEIFDIKTNNSKTVQGPEIYDVDYVKMHFGENDHIMGVSDKTRRSFTDMVGTKNYIYLSYSGKLFNSKNSFYSRCICVYDWNGTPVKKIVFDRDITCFTISENDDQIYAYDPNNSVFVKAKI